MLEAFYIILILVSIGILLLKLANVMKAGEIYSPEWSVVGLVGALIAFGFIFLMSIYNADTNTELIVYLWFDVALTATTFVLFMAEVLIFFLSLGKEKPKGKEQYGKRQRFGQN